jgi:hypothetical protein
MQSTAGEADLEHDELTLDDSSNVQATNILTAFGADANNMRNISSLLEALAIGYLGCRPISFCNIG